MISRALLRPTRRVAIILGMALHLESVIVHADVPTIGDMTACNQEAREGVPRPFRFPDLEGPG